nr:E3 SUMO-protein ligase ZBED1-like isoform X2 [Nothobranchius furzeri]
MASDTSSDVSHALDLKTPKTLKASVWQHFGFRTDKEKGQLDKSKVICKACQMEVKYCGNTTNLNNRILRHHQDLACKPSAGLQQMKFKESLQLPANSTRSHKKTEVIAGFICKNMRPYSVVENEGFKRLMKVVEPMKKATEVMSEEKSPTLSVMALLHALLLKEMTSLPEDSKVVKDMKNEIKKNLSTRRPCCMPPQLLIHASKPCHFWVRRSESTPSPG